MSQYGFHNGKSMLDAIDVLLRSVINAFENRVFDLTTLCDLSKAFDCFDHKELLLRIKYYGIRSPALQFFISYLSNREQLFCVNIEWSNKVTWSTASRKVRF